MALVGLTLLSAGVSYAQLPQFGHVVIVVGENSAFSQTYQSGAMPYLDSLAAKYGVGLNYYSDTHPSIGNYLNLSGGQIRTDDDSQTPSSFPISGDNIAHEVEQAGKSWKDYEESTNGCGAVNGGSYYVRHDPLTYYTNINTESANFVCMSQFPSDVANGTLPNLSWLSPNGCDDAHDCSLGTFDNWLQTEIAPLLQSPYFQPGGDGLLIVVFDEDDSSGSPNCSTTTAGQGCGGRVELVVISPFGVPGFQSGTGDPATYNASYEEANILRTMAEGLGVATSGLGGASTALPMSDFFVTAAGSITLTPNSLSFTEPFGSTSSSQSVVLSNAGSASISISSIGITGSNSSEFVQTYTCGKSLAPAANCAINVVFAPTSSGRATASLTISDSAPGSPQVVPLSGVVGDFAISSAPASASMTAGGSASFTLSVAPVGAFNQTVALGCSDSAAASTCSISPQAVTPSGVASTAKVTVTTGAPAEVAPPWRMQPRGPSMGTGKFQLLTITLLIIALATIETIRSSKRAGMRSAARPLASRLLFPLALLLAFGWLACGGGANSHTSGTPPGNYTITLTGTSGNLSHNITVTLKVN